jgi:hypothetical protein
MDAHAMEITLKACLREMRERLEEAISIAKAAEACAENGNTDKARSRWTSNSCYMR